MNERTDNQDERRNIGHGQYRHKVAVFETSYLMIIIDADALAYCYIK
jgi:hypothetical protein